MRATVLERLLVTERERQRIARDGLLAMPSIHERVVAENTGPYLVTNARGTFLQTRRRPADGVVRMGFSECPLDDEDKLLGELYWRLWNSGWDNQCSTIAQARERAPDSKMLVVSSEGLLAEVGGELSTDDMEKLMAARGYIVEVDGLRVLAGGLPSGAAMLTPAPAELGFYTRTGDWLGVLVQRADQIMLVG